MPSGPLPDPTRRRRNAPTIHGTILPADGYQGPFPDRPASLGAAGASWWDWAWRTPQAAAWDAGSVSVVGRRAALEDDWVAVTPYDTDGRKERLAIDRAMLAIDDRLGLTPKGRLALRWEIADMTEVSAPPTAIGKPRTRLRAVDTGA